jgi:hypothetical protein
MGLLKIYRRYCHRMRMNARATGEGQLEGVWRYKQEAQPGVALPAKFPFLAELALGGYTTIEDLDGADTYELQRIAKLAKADAETVLTALTPLLPSPP